VLHASLIAAFCLLFFFFSSIIIHIKECLVTGMSNNSVISILTNVVNAADVKHFRNGVKYVKNKGVELAVP